MRASARPSQPAPAPAPRAAPPPPRAAAARSSLPASRDLARLALDAVVVALSLLAMVAPGAWWRQFSVAAALSHAASLFRLHPPPSLAAMRADPRSTLLPWAATLTNENDAHLLAFLSLAGGSRFAAPPSALAAAGRLAAAAPATPAVTSIAALLASPGARTASAGCELAAGVAAALAALAGRGGGLKAMAFFRTYLPSRARSGAAGGAHAAAALAAAGLAAAGLRRVGAAAAAARVVALAARLR